MSGITVKLPIGTSDIDEGGFQYIKTYRELVKQNMRNLLLCIPGERPMIPLFGVGLITYLFEHESKLDEIETVIAEQVAMWMPFIEITDLRTAVQDDVGRLSIRYKIIPLQQSDQLNITVNNN
jgi:phage baseplate assembly protein W